MTVPCQLPYPDKYHTALEFYYNWPKEAIQPTHETQLLLYALSSQAAHGACKEPQPNSWDITAKAKWQAWTGLQDMDKTEAMRLFVKTLEEDEPNWYAFGVQSEPSDLPAQQASAAPGLRSIPADDVWRSPWVEVAEKHPHPRFEHSCCLVGSNMYLFGGNTTGGRYLSDVWQLNLETLAWTNVTTAYSQESNGSAPEEDAGSSWVPMFPACAAAVALPHRGRALLIGGHTKAQKNNPSAPLIVRVLDPARQTWGVLPCSGAVPAARGSHVAGIIGDKAYVFGGEGARLRLQQGVKVLDLMTNEWSELELPADGKKGPEPRTALAATPYQDRYFIIFGGGAVGKCHNDVWVLDTVTNMWDKPTIGGQRPSPRAGCCSALLGNRWYILGGGNNTAGCPDMYMLDLVRLGVSELEWEQVASFDRRAALACEGATLVAAPAYGALVAFGGYNGVYHNAVSAFKPSRRAASPTAADTAAVAFDRTSEIQPASPHNRATSPKTAENAEAIQKTAAALLEEAARAKEGMQQELALTRDELAQLQTSHAQAEGEVKTLQAALAAEKDKAFRLEVDVSELKTRLQGMDELELECRRYKQMLAEREKKAGGVWGFISGA
eukprot:jgi/Ulvmu1/5263/UM022_0057.1